MFSSGIILESSEFKESTPGKGGSCRITGDVNSIKCFKSMSIWIMNEEGKEMFRLTNSSLTLVVDSRW